MLRGFMAYKIKMSRLFESDRWQPVTILWAPIATVLAIKKYDNKQVAQVGVEQCKESRINKAQREEMKKLGLGVFRLRKEFECDAQVQQGQRCAAWDIFKQGDTVMIRGRTIGRGTTGVMKRWNFSGAGASHGVSKTHRSGGSTGSIKPGRVFPGTRMAGRYGNECVAEQGLRIIDFDTERELVVVAGSVPGKRGWVSVQERSS